MIEREQQPAAPPLPPDQSGSPGPTPSLLLQQRRGAGLGCMSLVAIFFVAVIAYGLAYQTRSVYKIDLGERLDRPFAVNFYEREPPERQRTVAANYDGTSYRWSRAESRIEVPGLGSQPLKITLRYDPVTNPNPNFALLVNERPVSLPPPQPGWNEATFQVPADWFRDGHLHFKLKATTFRPPGDARDLGVAVDWLLIEPVASDPLVFIRPPDSDFVPMVIASVLAVLVLLSLGLPILWSLGLGCLVVAGFTYWLINDRLNLTALMERDFIRSMFFLWVAAFIVAEYSPRIYGWLGVQATRRDGSWLAALAVLQFVLLYYFQLHPQFLASDTGLNIHRLEFVQQGRLVFTEPLPDNQLAPYPPALYVFLLPWTNLSGNSEAALGNLIEVTSSILAASGVLLVFYLARLMRRPQYLPPASGVHWQPRTHWGAIIAAAFYAINKYQFLIFSQGNHANLFGAWAFLLFLAVLAGTLHYFNKRALIQVETQVAAGDTGSPGRHPAAPDSPDRSGREEPAGLPPGPESFYDRKLLEIERRASGNVSRQVYGRTVRVMRNKYWPRVEGAIRYFLPLAALLLVMLAHYGAFLFANVFMLVFLAGRLVTGRRAALRQVIYVAFSWLTALLLAVGLYYHHHLDLIAGQFGRMLGLEPGPGRVGRPPFDLVRALTSIYTDARSYFGLMVLLAAAGGLALWLLARWRRRQNRPEVAAAGGWWRPGPLGTVQASLILTTLLFALAEEVQGLETRYQLYGVTALVILAALFLGRVWRSGPGGVLLVAGLFLFQLLDALIFWLERVNYYFLG